MRSPALVNLLGIALVLAGCGRPGYVEQGRVIAYNPQTRQITLVREGVKPGAGILPPVTIEAPADPEEMGPSPQAGGLLLLDTRRRRIVVYDRASQSLRTIQYTPVAARGKKTVTVYSPKEHVSITFPVSDDLLAMPADTWRAGDVVRYYYKVPGHALRLMNVTRTDLSKSAG